MVMDKPLGNPQNPHMSSPLADEMHERLERAFAPLALVGTAFFGARLARWATL